MCWTAYPIKEAFSTSFNFENTLFSCSLRLSPPNIAWQFSPVNVRHFFKIMFYFQDFFIYVAIVSAVSFGLFLNLINLDCKPPFIFPVKILKDYRKQFQSIIIAAICCIAEICNVIFLKTFQSNVKRILC